MPAGKKGSGLVASYFGIYRRESGELDYWLSRGQDGYWTVAENVGTEGGQLVDTGRDFDDLSDALLYCISSAVEVDLLSEPLSPAMPYRTL